MARVRSKPLEAPVPHELRRPTTISTGASTAVFRKSHGVKVPAFQLGCLFSAVQEKSFVLCDEEQVHGPGAVQSPLGSFSYVIEGRSIKVPAIGSLNAHAYPSAPSTQLVALSLDPFRPLVRKLIGGLQPGVAEAAVTWLGQIRNAGAALADTLSSETGNLRVISRSGRQQSAEAVQQPFSDQQKPFWPSKFSVPAPLDTNAGAANDDLAPASSGASDSSASPTLEKDSPEVSSAAWQRRRASIRAVFAALDGDNDGLVSADDLRQYAAGRGLPSGYAVEFVSLAQQGNAQQGRKQREGRADREKCWCGVRGRNKGEQGEGQRQGVSSSEAGKRCPCGWDGAGCHAEASLAPTRAVKGDGGQSGVSRGSRELLQCQASIGFAAYSSERLPPVDPAAFLFAAARRLKGGVEAAFDRVARKEGLGFASLLSGASAAATAGGGAAGAGGGVAYAEFEAFVDARDRTLWASFRCLDKNGDGRISHADVERSIRDVLYRCNHNGNDDKWSITGAADNQEEQERYRAIGLGGMCTVSMVEALRHHSQAGGAQAQAQVQRTPAEHERWMGLGGGVAASSKQCQGGGKECTVEAQGASAQAFTTPPLRPSARPAPPPPSASFEEFRDFFTLLPACDHLFDYWMGASCPVVCRPAAAAATAGESVGVAGAAAVLGGLSAAAAGSSRGGTGGGVSRSSSSSSRKGARGSSGSRPGGGSIISISSSSSRSGSASRQQLVGSDGVWRHLVAGGMAGAASRTATAPLETLRLRMMVASNQSLGQMCAQLWREAGWRAFFKGNIVNVVRSAPQKAIDFFAFETFKQIFATVAPNAPLGPQVMAAGALAGATSTLLLYPLDVVRSRLTVSSRAQYSGIANALVTIAAREGAPALYRGLGASLLSILPEAAITYGCFDLLKGAVQRATNASSVGVLPALACGVASAFTGQLVAYPLELVARRMQVAGAAAGAAAAAAAAGSKQSIPAIVQSIVAERGIGGLYQGIVPASLKVVPMAIVSFGVYESAKYLLVRVAEAEERRKAAEMALWEERRTRTVFLPICGLCRENPACEAVSGGRTSVAGQKWLAPC